MFISKNGYLKVIYWVSHELRNDAMKFNYSFIVANPRTILFITHNGMLSTQEAIWYGVPMIGFPIFGDQFQNTNRCVKFGFAKRLSILNFTADELKGAILEVLLDPR